MISVVAPSRLLSFSRRQHCTKFAKFLAAVNYFDYKIKTSSLLFRLQTMLLLLL
jgi:hypothetical protein